MKIKQNLHRNNKSKKSKKNTKNYNELLMNYEMPMMNYKSKKASLIKNLKYWMKVINP